MLKLNLHVIVEFARDLAWFEMSAANVAEKPASGAVSDDDARTLQTILDRAGGAHGYFYLPATKARAERFQAAIEQKADYGAIRLQIQILREALEDELKQREVFFMDAGRAIHFYAEAKVLGEGVIKEFPDLLTDADEAGKCFGCGRFTAVVFHLMRVMEAGLQELGNILGVKLVDEKNWQNILDETNKAINAMPRGPDKAQLAEFGALLYNVKLAWRNEVMHPKATYTEEEAENLLGAVKAFMGKLAKLHAASAATSAALTASVSSPSASSVP